MSELRFDVAGASVPKRYFEALTRSSMAHAYCFSGPPGSGKKTFARRLAQSLLCLSPGSGAVGYDGTCRSCVLFESGDDTRHPDFFEHVGQLKIGEPDAALVFYESGGLTARQVVRQLAMQSYAGGTRVLLLGDLTFATDEAANALLKFLEDPPGDCTTIVTTSAPDTLLPTVRSRLLDIAFPPLNAQEIATILRARGAADDDAKRIAALAGGNATRALEMLETGEESLRPVVAFWFFANVRGGPASSHWATRETLAEALDIVKSLARDWIARDLPGVATALAPDYAAEIERLHPLDRNSALQLLEKLEDAHRKSQSNVTPGLVADFVRMALAPA